MLWSQNPNSRFALEDYQGPVSQLIASRVNPMAQAQGMPPPNNTAAGVLPPVPGATAGAGAAPSAPATSTGMMSMPAMPQLAQPQHSSSNEFMSRLRDFMIGAGRGTLADAGSNAAQSVMAGRRYRDAQSLQQQQYNNALAIQQYNLNMERWKLEQEQAAAQRVMAGRNRTAKYLVEQGILPPGIAESMNAKQLVEFYKQHLTGQKPKWKEVNIDGVTKIYDENNPGVAPVQLDPADQPDLPPKPDDTWLPHYDPKTGEHLGSRMHRLNRQTGQYEPLEGVPLKPVTGFDIKVGPDGTHIRTGAHGKRGGKLSEQQSKDVIYFTRGDKALKTLEVQDDKGRLVDALSQYKGHLITDLIGQKYSSSLVEPRFRKAMVAGMDFLAAVLRKDTGAAITEAEMQQYGLIFLPQPGEDKATLEYKAQARKIAVEAIARGLFAEQALAYVQDRLNTNSAPGATSPAAPKRDDPLGLF